MTINIVTDSYKTFQGEEATLRAGAVERYATGEFKHSRKPQRGQRFVPVCRCQQIRRSGRC